MAVGGIDGLLALSRAGRVTLESTEVNMNALVEEIEDYLQSNTPRPAGVEGNLLPLDERQLHDLLVELEFLLSPDDIRASLLFADSRRLLRAVLGASTDKLGRQIASFDFDASLKTLRAFMPYRFSDADQ